MPRRSGHAKKIENVHWTYGSWSLGALGAGTSAVNVFAAQHLPETLLRMRGMNMVHVDGTQTPPTFAGVNCGLILVPEGTGTTVLWSPTTDGDAPWIWAHEALVGYEEMVTDVIDIPGITFDLSVIDNKAMRRVRNQEIQFVAENATIGGAVSVNIRGSCRVLFGN